jgi:rod shape determining protein RodA
MSFSAQGGLKKTRLDWVLLACTAALVLIGTLAVLSSVTALPHQARIIKVQFMAVPLAFTLFAAVWSLNYQIYQDQWKFVYCFLLLFLAGVLFFGVMDKGSRSWYRLPFFSVQPSEFARIGIILVLANFLDKRIGKIRELKTVMGAFALCLPVFFLLIRQPDFSAILVTLPVVIVMLFAAGASLFHLFIIVGYAFLAGLFPILWTVITLNPELTDSAIVYYFFQMGSSLWWAAAFVAGVSLLAWLLHQLSVRLYANVSGAYFAGAALVVILGFFSGMLVKNQMKEYQQKRLEVFLSPESDPRGAGYNLLQARIAIGSGGVFGRGIFSGTQSRLGFVPERHTDFILAVVGEEMGFAGMTLVAVLYALLMRRLMNSARLARDRFGYLVCCGIMGMFLVYFCINFGMLLGLAPVAGVPLPLVSYGGSNLVATLMALGIAQSVYARRYALV